MDLKEANVPGTMLSLFIFNLWQKAIITPAFFCIINKEQNPTLLLTSSSAMMPGSL